MFTVLFAVIVVGWVAAAVLGTQAYFRGEQTKPIHERNWNSQGFERIALTVTAQDTESNNRVPGFVVSDAFASRVLPSNG